MHDGRWLTMLSPHRGDATAQGFFSKTESQRHGVSPIRCSMPVSSCTCCERNRLRSRT